MGWPVVKLRAVLRPTWAMLHGMVGDGGGTVPSCTWIEHGRDRTLSTLSSQDGTDCMEFTAVLGLRVGFTRTHMSEKKRIEGRRGDKAGRRQAQPIVHLGGYTGNTS